MNNMNNQEINIAIAEVCGVFNQPFPRIPNYCGDLNAMHEAEKVLSLEQWQLYAAWLFKATTRPQHATARQRAKAFLKAIKEWKE